MFAFCLLFVNCSLYYELSANEEKSMKRDNTGSQCLALLKQFLTNEISQEEFDARLAAIEAALHAQQQLFEAAA